MDLLLNGMADNNGIDILFNLVPGSSDGIDRAIKDAEKRAKIKVGIEADKTGLDGVKSGIKEALGEFQSKLTGEKIGTIGREVAHLGGGFIAGTTNLRDFTTGLVGVGSQALSMLGPMGAVAGAILNIGIASHNAAKEAEYNTHALQTQLLVASGLDRQANGDTLTQRLERERAALDGNTSVALVQARAQEHQRDLAAAQLDILGQQQSVLLGQLDTVQANNGVGGQRITREQNLLDLQEQAFHTLRHNNETDVEYQTRRNGLMTAYISARQADNTERARVFDMQTQTGLLQHQLDKQHAGVSLGTQGLTLNQAVARVHAEILRIQREEVNAAGNLSKSDQERLQALAQQESQMREQAKSQGEQYAQAEKQRREALFQLRVQTELAQAHGQFTSKTIQHLDISRELSRVEEQIGAFRNLGAHASQRTLDAYGVLVQHAQTLRDAETQIIQARLQGMQLSPGIIALLDRWTERGQARAQADLSFLEVGRLNTAQLEERIRLERQSVTNQTGMLQGALQAQQAGQSLTASQSRALSNADSILAALNNQIALNERQLDTVNSDINNPNLAEADRNRLLGERTQLLQDHAALEKNIADIQVGQNGPSFNQQMAVTVRNLAGEYRSASAVMGGVATQAVNTLNGAFKQHLAAVIEGKETIGDALQGILHETLLSLATESAVKALFNYAEAFAAFATYRPAEGASHLAAAGTYTAVAALAGVGAALTTPASTSSGAGAGNAGSISGVGASAGPGASEPTRQSITVNINGAALVTREHIEDAVLAAYDNGNRRRGRG